jgi:hypothetical protein
MPRGVEHTAGAIIFRPMDSDAVRDRLAELAAEQATLEAELASFHADYVRRVGVVMAQVDELEARILRLQAQRTHAPGDERAAAAAQERARRTTAEAEAVPQPAGPLPTGDLKRLFRDAAKRMHPDLAAGDEERAHAEAFMKRLNHAYRAGDADAILHLVEQWDASPFGTREGVARDRTSRRAGALSAAVARAQAAIDELRASQLAQLMERAMAASAAGGDYLAELRADADAALASARARLARLEPAPDP